MKQIETKQIKAKLIHADVTFNDVAAIADRMVWTGRLPTVNAIHDELHGGSLEKVRQCFTLWKAGYNHIQAEKTHISDLPPELQHLLAEAFEKRIAALRAKLNAESAEIRVERDRLAKVNEQLTAQIKVLMSALGDAEVKIADQNKRISMLKKEIASERNLRINMEQRIREAPKEPTIVENRLDDPPPAACGGA